LGLRGAADDVEVAGFVVHVVLGVVAIDAFIAQEVLEMDVADGFNVPGVLVVDDFIGLEQHVDGFNAGGDAEVFDRAVEVFVEGFDVDGRLIRDVRTWYPDVYVRVSTGYDLLRFGR
jgi:hypothetical protein